MSTLHPAIYTEVEPATDKHGTQVVARLGHFRVAVPYPYELSEWADIHAVALEALLAKRGTVGKSAWSPGLLGAGVVWTFIDQQVRSFTIQGKA